MTIRIIPFDPHTVSDELWAAFNETRRAIAHEFWPIRWEISGYDLWYETLEQVGGAHHLVLASGARWQRRRAQRGRVGHTSPQHRASNS